MQLPHCAQVLDGALYIGGCSAVALAEEYGTPLYVYDESVIRAVCGAFVSAMERHSPGGRVHYASKAFPSVAVNAVVNSEGLGVDAASIGELEAALRAGVAPSDITMHGSNKTDEEIARAVAVSVGRFVLDSVEEVGRLQAEAERQGRDMDVYLRLNPGVEAETFEAVRTACEDTKFGVPIQGGMAMEAAERILESSRLRFKGVHCHVGSHVFKLDCFPMAAESMMDFIKALKDRHGVEPEEVVMGGGFGTWYREGDTRLDPAACVEYVAKAVDGAASARGLGHKRLSLEPGRMIVAEACIALYTTGVIKTLPGIRTYLSIDGGLNENPRPLLYGAEYTAIAAGRMDEPHTAPYRVAGKACETDTVIRDALLPHGMKRGDLVGILTSGAYQLAIAGNYQRTPKPCAVMVRDGSARVIVRRQTVDDVLAFDVL